MVNLSGLYAPIPVAFKEGEKLALKEFEANLQRWIAQPLDGVVLPGSNSEAAYLSEGEKEQLWQVCAQAFTGTGKHWFAGTGVERSVDTIRLTKKAAELGASAALVLPPHYFTRSMDHKALYTHYTALADESPIPILIYNMPAFTGIDFELKTLAALAEHPNIVGMKDSSSNVVKMAMLLKACPKFAVFAGTGGALLPFLSIGAAGGIMALANVAAEPLRALAEAFTQGEMDQARKIQLAVAELNFAVTAGYGVPGLKYAMDQLGFYGGEPRKPLLPAGETARTHLDRLIDELSAHFDLQYP